MNTTESSSSKVPYDLRPRKQVERRMMAHVFQLLSEVGFPISTYRYAGFGAFFFVDFILFRQLLGITDMISIEHDLDHQKRVKFNCPYKDIAIAFESSTEYISKMSRDKSHILWLDYDGPIEQAYLTDISSAVSTLSSGSLFVVTIDVDYDKAKGEGIRDSLPGKRANLWYKLYKDTCNQHFNPLWDHNNFSSTELPKSTVSVINSAISEGLNMRDGVKFELLFNFLYADGHQMLTFGGLISSEQDRRKLRQIEWKNLPFIRRNISDLSYHIDVPVLTRRERLYIDSNMPCDDNWEITEFEIEKEAIRSYRDVYRYCPLYAELLL